MNRWVALTLTKEPRALVRVVGQAPLAATVYELDRLRCNLCGEVFTAPEPEGIGPEKYDETTAAMIALYFTGRQHAGENLRDVLQHRVKDLATPVQMCDALSRNTPKLSDGAEILLANCLAHGRRQFVDIAANFPESCRYVLETLGDVYKL